ncbi:MAG: hypothetical protein ACM3PY_08550 [Omnitrophica WOR_2 bacterium]
MNSLVFAHLNHLLAPLLKGNLYLDPGTGSFIIQLVVATLLGALFFLRGYISKGFQYIRRLFTKSSEVKPDEKQ